MVQVKGRVLVVDDEEIIRKLIKKLLEINGYHFETASSGEEAIQIYTEALGQKETLDAVILDLQMPGMDGVETLKNLLRIDPLVKAVICTAYFTDPAVLNYTNYGFSAALIKPFTIKEFSETLENLLAPGRPV